MNANNSGEPTRRNPDAQGEPGARFGRGRHAGEAAAALNAMYPVQISVNLSKDTYRVVAGRECFASLDAADGALSELVDRAAAEMEGKSGESVRRLFGPQAMLSRFSEAGDSQRLEVRQRCRDGKVRWVEVVAVRVENASGGDALGMVICRFIDGQKAMENRLRLAEIDGMTGIYNKTTTEELISERLADGSARSCALMLADLDGLKAINDTLGHVGGDAAICGMSGLLRTQFRQTDVVGRVGGDEFVVFLQDISQAQVCRSMTAFMEKLSAVRIREYGGAPLRCSVGIAMGCPGDTYATLFKRADLAMYHVKRNGKDDFAVYVPEMEHDAYRHAGHWACCPPPGRFGPGDAAMAAALPPCALAMLVNLTRNRCAVLRREAGDMWAGPEAGKFDEMAAWAARARAPRERAGFLSAFGREGLMAAQARGEADVGWSGPRTGPDGACRRAFVKAIFTGGQGNDIMAILLAGPEEG